MRIADTPKERVYFLVARYFQFWAHIAFRRWHPRVIAITGSTGKTTMLHLLEIQLGPKAHFSHNANSIYGVSFDILGMHGISGSRSQWLRQAAKAPFRALRFTHSERLYIVEVDGARPRGASMLAEWLRPDITAWISVEQSHAEFFDAQVENGEFATHLDAIVHEFMSLPRNTQRAVIYDGMRGAMNRAIKAEKESLPSRLIGVDVSTYLHEFKISLDGTEFVTTNGTYTFSCLMPREIATQLAMTEEVMKLLKLPIKYDMTQLTLPPGRSTVLRGIQDTTLIDGTYNAQLGSMLSSLNMFSELDVRPRWIVLGDIIELGDSEAAQHVSLGHHLAHMSFDRIILVGRRLKAHTLPLLKDLPIPVAMCANAHEVLEYLQAEIQGKETIFFKGSQHLEWVVENMLADPADVSRLPRQTPADRARRKKLGYS